MNNEMNNNIDSNSNSNSKQNSRTREHFFPFDNNQESVNTDTINSNDNYQGELSDKTNDDKSCMQTYTPIFESVGDVCSPTATFKNEFNAQGLNYPEGYLNPVIGSPLTQT
jgi:hypothetical protein